MLPVHYDNIEKRLDDGVLVEKLLSCLTERQAKILRLRVGFDGKEPCTLREIGDMFGITSNRVMQIEKMALRKLRAKTRTKELEKYL